MNIGCKRQGVVERAYNSVASYRHPYFILALVRSCSFCAHASAINIRRGRADALAESVGLKPSDVFLVRTPLGMEYYLGRADALAAGYSPIEEEERAEWASARMRHAKSSPSFYDATARYTARAN